MRRLRADRLVSDLGRPRKPVRELRDERRLELIEPGVPRKRRFVCRVHEIDDPVAIEVDELRAAIQLPAGGNEGKSLQGIFGLQGLGTDARLMRSRILDVAPMISS